MIEQQLYVGTTPKGESAFLGEVPTSEFITGDALANAIGLTVGTTQHSNESWLKFLDPVDGLTKYIAKKPYRHSVSWNQLNAVNVVYGDRTAVINGDTYKVRLLKGANSDPTTAASDSFDHPGTHGSEWNRLMYRISAKPTAGFLASEGITEGDWAQYTETELVLVSAGGNGFYNWCQEASGTNRVIRGAAGVSLLALRSASVASSALGWRPCLELVE